MNSMRMATRVRYETAARAIIADVRPAAGSRVFTLGYQGRDLKEVLEIVQRHGIEQVIDVRENTSSKKLGFAAAELKEALVRIRVAYSHLPELGCSRVSRHTFWRDGSKDSFLDDYRHRLAERPQAFADLVRRTQLARTLLLCLERDPSRCHRAILVERLQTEGIFAQDL
jgi:uncharacterized protein (DUF488 family)